MEIPLKQAPDRLFDQQKWSEFISHFDTREIALGRLSVHPSDPGGFYREGDAKLVKSGEGRWKQIDELYELGIALVGDFKTKLIKGQVLSSGISLEFDQNVERERTPLGFQKVPFRRVCPTSWASPNDANSGWNSANRGVSCRNGPASGHLDIGGGQGGLCGFYREIAGVGLVFPRADRPIAVEFPGYPVVRLRPILLELAGRGVACPPQKAGPPSTPPHW